MWIADKTYCHFHGHLSGFYLRQWEKMQLDSWSWARRKGSKLWISQKEQSFIYSTPLRMIEFHESVDRIIKQCRSKTRHNHSTPWKSIRRKLEKHYLKASVVNCLCISALLLLNNDEKIIKPKFSATWLCHKNRLQNIEIFVLFCFLHHVNFLLLCFALWFPLRGLAPLLFKTLVPDVILSG